MKDDKRGLYWRVFLISITVLSFLPHIFSILQQEHNRAVFNEIDERYKAEIAKKEQTLRNTFKNLSYSDSKINQFLIKYDYLGYDYGSVNFAIETKYKIQSMNSSNEKLTYLCQVYGGVISNLKDDYNFTDMEIIEMANRAIPLSLVVHKLKMIKIIHNSETVERVVDAMHRHILRPDEVSLIDSSYVLFELENFLNVNPLSYDAGQNQLMGIFFDFKGKTRTFVGSQIRTTKGMNLLIMGDNNTGWQHIANMHINNTEGNGDFFGELFPETVGNENLFVREWIQDAIMAGVVKELNSCNKWAYIYEPYADNRKMAIIVDYNFTALGTTQTMVIDAFPCKTKPNCFDSAELKT
jgi:hypothetical protein